MASGDEGAPLREVAATQEPPRAQIREALAFGTGCPIGSWDASIADDGASADITFADYSAVISDRRTQEMRACQVTLRVEDQRYALYVPEVVVVDFRRNGGMAKYTQELGWAASPTVRLGAGWEGDANDPPASPVESAEVTVTQVSARGRSCNDRTVRTAMAADGRSFHTAFDSFFADGGDSVGAPALCELDFALSAAPGRSYAIASYAARGIASLPQGVRGELWLTPTYEGAFVEPQSRGSRRSLRSTRVHRQ